VKLVSVHPRPFSIHRSELLIMFSENVLADFGRQLELENSTVPHVRTVADGAELFPTPRADFRV
jgi:hypothetical protein